MQTYRNYINGKWVESVSTDRAENVNPANTDDIIGQVRLATRDEARRAVEVASEAFRDWRATP
nr:aldehyde dehydrogenase family protein [Acidobacteriota bacterium]